MSLANVVRINLKVLSKDEDVDDLIRFLIVIAECRRGYLTGAFCEIVERYEKDMSMEDVLEQFWEDVKNREARALELVDSLRGDREIIYKIEQIFSRVLFDSAKVKDELFMTHEEIDLLRDRVEAIRDRWVDQVVSAGIEQQERYIWEPQLVVDQESSFWRLLSLPVSYKLVNDIAKVRHIDAVKALTLINKNAAMSHSTQEEALKLFFNYAEYIRTLGRDTLSEKFKLVRLIQQVNLQGGG